MKSPISLALLVLLLSCGTMPPSPPQKSIPTIADLSCGAIVGKPTGNANLMLFLNLEKLRDALRFQPQIIVWRPSRWASGQKLRVNFLDGDEASRKFVMSVAGEWVSGVKLSLTESAAADAEVRITFTGNGVWSQIGRLAEDVARGRPTMGLGGFMATSDPALRRAYVLHEFGHALGALHEHQRRDAPLTWNRDVVYEHYLRLYGWSQTQVDMEVILPLQYDDVATSPEFDVNSVMMYPIHKEFTKEQFVQPWNSQLTSWDRKVVAQLYQ